MWRRMASSLSLNETAVRKPVSALKLGAEALLIWRISRRMAAAAWRRGNGIMARADKMTRRGNVVEKMASSSPAALKAAASNNKALWWRYGKYNVGISQCHRRDNNDSNMNNISKYVA